MSTTIDIRELPARLDELLALTAAGPEVILSDGTVPCARLVPLPQAERIAGLHMGAVQMSPDFNAPLPDDFWAGRPYLRPVSGTDVVVGESRLT